MNEALTFEAKRTSQLCKRPSINLKSIAESVFGPEKINKGDR